MEAKKFISSKKEGEYEIKKFHVINIPINRDLLIDVCERFDDNEEAYSVGINIDWNDEIICVEIDKLIPTLENMIEEADADDYIKDIKEVLKCIKGYEGYDIWL